MSLKNSRKIAVDIHNVKIWNQGDRCKTNIANLKRKGRNSDKSISYTLFPLSQNLSITQLPVVVINSKKRI